MAIYARSRETNFNCISGKELIRPYIFSYWNIIQFAAYNTPSYNEIFLVINFDQCTSFSFASNAIHVTAVAAVFIINFGLNVQSFRPKR